MASRLDKALEWFPFDAVAWLISPSVMAMSLEAQGAYIRLLAHQWRDGSIPSNPAKIARMCGTSLASFTDIWAELSDNFHDLGDGRLVNLRLEKDRTASDLNRLARSEAGKAGMAKRWAKDNKTEAPIEPPHNAVITPLYQSDNPPITNDNEIEKEKRDRDTSKQLSTTLSPVATKNEVEPKEPPKEKRKPNAAELWEMLPVRLQTEAVKSALGRYFTMRREKKYGTLTQTSLEQYAKAWADFEPECLAKGLNDSAMAQYRKIVIKAEPRPGHRFPTKPETMDEKLERRMRNMERSEGQ